MTERLQAVFDTNVYVSAFLSRNPTSPTQELIQRWKSGEFDLLVSDAMIVVQIFWHCSAGWRSGSKCRQRPLLQ